MAERKLRFDEDYSNFMDESSDFEYRYEDNYYTDDYDFYDYEEANGDVYPMEMPVHHPFAADYDEDENEEYETGQVSMDELSSMQTSPQKTRNKLKKLSRIERVLIVTIIFVAVSFAVATVFVRTKITDTTNQVTDIQSTIDSKETAMNELRQKSNELLRSDRVKKIAEKQGLKSNDANLKQVK
jgi:cell division protein FtsL